MVTQTCDDIDVGTPFYAPGWRPARPAAGIKGDLGSGPPALHKFDQADFVRRFFAEVTQTAQGGPRPSSLVPTLAPTPVSALPQPPALDVDALDLWSGGGCTRFRKLYQPMHFRFYLAACELRCLVPGLPAPSRAKVKKVELVVRRVALVKGKQVVDPQEWAWIDVPDPFLFPDPVPTASLQMARRITGNSRVWWPIPAAQTALEGEQRFPMSRVVGPGLTERALYFAFAPLASGEMYGPLRTVVGPPPALKPEDYEKLPEPKDPGRVTKTLPELSPNQPDTMPAQPLVRAPSNFALRPATIASFRSVGNGWLSLLGRLVGKTPIDGPRPKFEPPPLLEPTPANAEVPPAAWGYVIRCVATLELAPGCLVESWGSATQPAVIAPQFDPFGGRPTQIEVPSMKELAQMVPAGTDLQAKGGLSFSIGSGFAVENDKPGAPKLKDGVSDLCFFGIPLFTICAYVMFSLALFIVLPVLSFLLLFKFCLGKKP